MLHIYFGRGLFFLQNLELEGARQNFYNNKGIVSGVPVLFYTLNLLHYMETVEVEYSLLKMKTSGNP